MNSRPSSHIAQWLLVTTFFGFGFFACSKEKDPIPETVLTINVTPDFFPQATDNWVFITNESGDVLDIENIQNGTTYALMANPGVDEFTVTFFKKDGDAPWSWFNFESFEGIAKSTVMTLDYPASTNFHNTTGIANFTINNYTASSAPTEKIWFSTGYSAGQSVQLSSATFNNNTFTVPGYIGEEPADFFITAYDGDEPVYAFVEGVGLSDNISLDFNSFSAFDHTINLGAINGFGQILAGNIEHKGYDGYVLGSTHLAVNQLSEKKLGFNDGFDFYSTHFASFGPVTVMYRKEGAAPSPSFNWLRFSSEVLNNTPTGLDFTISTTYSWKQATWSYQLDTGGVYWYANGDPSATCRIHHFPKELVEKYPVLDFSKLNFAGVSATKNVDGYTYENWIEDRFAAVPEERETMESWTLSFQ